MDFYDIAKEYEISDPCIADAIGSLLTGDIAKAEHALKRYRELNGTACDGAPMEKPDWKDAPDWAEWLAMDLDGEWFWFEDKPSTKTKVWWATGEIMDISPKTPNYPIRWTFTLERRPK